MTSNITIEKWQKTFIASYDNYYINFISPWRQQMTKHTQWKEKKKREEGQTLKMEKLLLVKM